jgi:hypothetical protein
MLATLVDEPFHHPGWTYEEKYDGIRILAYKEEGSQVTLRSRNSQAASSSLLDASRCASAKRAHASSGRFVAPKRPRFESHRWEDLGFAQATGRRHVGIPRDGARKPPNYKQP